MRTRRKHRIEVKQGWEDEYPHGNRSGDLVTASYSIYVDGHLVNGGFDIFVRKLGICPEIEMYISPKIRHPNIWKLP